MKLRNFAFVLLLGVCAYFMQGCGGTNNVNILQEGIAHIVHDTAGTITAWNIEPSVGTLTAMSASPISGAALFSQSTPSLSAKLTLADDRLLLCEQISATIRAFDLNETTGAVTVAGAETALPGTAFNPRFMAAVDNVICVFGRQGVATTGIEFTTLVYDNSTASLTNAPGTPFTPNQTRYLPDAFIIEGGNLYLITQTATNTNLFAERHEVNSTTGLVTYQGGVDLGTRVGGNSGNGAPDGRSLVRSGNYLYAYVGGLGGPQTDYPVAALLETDGTGALTLLDTDDDVSGNVWGSWGGAVTLGDRFYVGVSNTNTNDAQIFCFEVSATKQLELVTGFPMVVPGGDQVLRLDGVFGNVIYFHIGDGADAELRTATVDTTTGALTFTTQSHLHGGGGMVPNTVVRQGKLLVIGMSGQARVHVFTLDSTTGELTLVSEYTAADGVAAGVRHLPDIRLTN